MVDRSHLPMDYGSAFAQAQRDADMIASLDAIKKMNRLTEERVQMLEMEMQMARTRQQEQQQQQQQQQDQLDHEEEEELLAGRLQHSCYEQRTSLFDPLHGPTMRSLFSIEEASPQDAFMNLPDRRERMTLAAAAAYESRRPASSDEKQKRALSSSSTPKVQKDLRSRTQPRTQPRKRRTKLNLSEEERRQLVKSRNREHARNTRRRKKARQIELEENESKLEILLVSKQLEAERLERLKEFIAARQNMMNTSAVAVQDDSFSDLNLFDEWIHNLVVDPLESFEFNVRGLASFPASSNESSPISKMKRFDKELRRQIFDSQEISSSTFLAYEIQDGVDGIAISKNGSCYAQLDLILYRSATPTLITEPTMDTNETTREKVVLRQILIKARFGAGSDEKSTRLASMEWTVLEDR